MLTFMTRGAAATALLLCVACGGDKSSAAPSPSPGSPVTITITAAGASPRTVTVTPGSQITFINNDSVVHEMFSDPHPEHTDCPEFDTVGRLTPGQTHQTKNLVNAGSCGFHDHLNPSNIALRGTVNIR